MLCGHKPSVWARPLHTFACADPVSLALATPDPSRFPHGAVPHKPCLININNNNNNNNNNSNSSSSNNEINKTVKLY
jgi:hypothetical protein